MIDIFRKLAAPAALMMFAGTAQAANVAINGDFETGTLDPWLTFPNGGTVTISTPPAGNPSAGSFSAELNASVDPAGGPASFPQLKLERVAAGLLTPNAPVTVSFDLFGSVSGVGGVFISELFSEFAGPGATNEILSPNAVPTDTWQTITYNTTLGGIVDGGLSLLFKADCGASAGCAINAFIDNVVIDTNTGVIPVPAAVWLFGSGLLGLIGVARRKRAA